MNIQIFSRNKGFDSKKAERYFKERRISFQKIDLDQKGLSKRELESVVKSVGSLSALFRANAKSPEASLFPYLLPDDQFQKLLDYPELIQDPIVRNGPKATVGYHPEIWKEWENE